MDGRLTGLAEDDGDAGRPILGDPRADGGSEGRFGGLGTVGNVGEGAEQEKLNEVGKTRGAGPWRARRWESSVRWSAGPYIPGKPPLPRMASIWRIIFFAPPPFIIFIICCICWNCFSS